MNCGPTTSATFPNRAEGEFDFTSGPRRYWYFDYAGWWRKGGPRNPKSSGQQPLCHASDPAARKMFKREWREFLCEYRRASIDHRAGYFDRETPDGSYRPPLITPYSASRL